MWFVLSWWHTLVILNVGSYHSNPFSHLPFSNVYGVTLTISKHPRNGGRSRGLAEVWGQTLKEGRSFRPTNLFGILLNFQCFLTSPLIAGSMCQALSVQYSCIRTPIFNSMIRIYFYSRPSNHSYPCIIVTCIRPIYQCPPLFYLFQSCFHLLLWMYSCDLDI